MSSCLQFNQNFLLDFALNVPCKSGSVWKGILEGIFVSQGMRAEKIFKIKNWLIDWLINHKGFIGPIEDYEN